MAFVVAKPDHRLSEEQIISHCKGRIAGYKVPRYVVFVDQMPMAGVGKVQKFMLRETGLSELKRRGISI
jgi:fatty-acyl-CoA synthase